MNSPTNISAGDVAVAGIIKNNGAKNSDNANIPAADRAVSPVLPPSATPEGVETAFPTKPTLRHKMVLIILLSLRIIST